MYVRILKRYVCYVYSYIICILFIFHQMITPERVHSLRVDKANMNFKVSKHVYSLYAFFVKFTEVRGED